MESKPVPEEAREILDDLPTGHLAHAGPGWEAMIIAAQVSVRKVPLADHPLAGPDAPRPR